MTVARAPGELEPRPRAVAIGSFDGVHVGHRRVLQAAVDAGLTPTVVTFDPHPRVALGHRVELLTTLERRLELFADGRHRGRRRRRVHPGAGSRSRRPSSRRRSCVAIGTQVVVAGADFRFGHGRSGDLDLLGRLGFDARKVPLVEGVSSTLIRGLLRAGEVDRAAPLLGRAVEVDGIVVSGDARGGTLGLPDRQRPGRAEPARAGTRHLRRVGGRPPRRHVNRRRTRTTAAPSCGSRRSCSTTRATSTGKRLIVELWRRLRDERAFASEADLVEQIALDVEQTRAAEHPLKTA